MKLYQIPPRIWMEQDAFSRLPKEAKRLSASKAMIFAGPNIKKAGYVSATESGLDAEGISSQVFTDIEPEPSDNTALKAAQVMRGESPARIPFSPPTKLEMLVNLKNAGESRLVIPEALLRQAQQVTTPTTP